MFDTTEELLAQIRLGEDSALELKDLEYKSDKVVGPHRDSMADELAAMANTTSGVFVLGVDDKTQSVVGIPMEKLEIVERWLHGICNDLITPQLLCRIRKVIIPQGDEDDRVIIRVDIPRSLHVHQSPGGYFNRIGSSKRPMTPDVLARLFQQRSQARLIRFDEQAVPTAPPSCLEESLWEKFKTSYSPDDKDEFLLKLKLLSKDDNGNIHPSVSGLLLASLRPSEYIPNAYIQAVCYRGTERNAAYQLDAKDLLGPLNEQVLEACRFVQKNMSIKATKAPARQDLPEYSMHAVFEAIVNAVAHRDYSIHGSKIRLHMFKDRLEIFSPGTIPNTMTIESLSLRQSARNELLASLLARCPVGVEGYAGDRSCMMDKRGEGVPIIISESEKLAGKRPEFQLIDDSELMLTIYSARHESPPDL